MKLDCIQVKLSQIEVEAVLSSIRTEMLGGWEDCKQCGLLRAICFTYQLRSKEELISYFVENGDEKDFAYFEVYYKLTTSNYDEYPPYSYIHYFVTNVADKDILYKDTENISEIVNSEVEAKIVLDE